MYNGADNYFPEGADPDPNGGGFKEGEEGLQNMQISEEEDAGSEEGQDEGENNVKVEEVSDGTEDEEYEGFVKMLPNPILPTQKMIDMHMVTHTPYANWCTHCVRGRGAMYAHRMIKERDDQVPVICGD